MWGMEGGVRGQSQKKEVPLRKPLTSPICSQGPGKAESTTQAQLEASQVSPFLPTSDWRALVPCMSLESLAERIPWKEPKIPSQVHRLRLVQSWAGPTTPWASVLGSVGWS